MRFSMLGWTDHICDSALDTTTSWHDFVDSLRRKLARRNWKYQNSHNRINNTNLDNTYSDYSHTFTPTASANIATTDHSPLTVEDHAMFQYYINTVSRDGWDVESKLWNALSN